MADSSSASVMAAKLDVARGALIVVEGLDRSGKSSQCAMLADALNKRQSESAVSMRFPDRTTPIGTMIDAYLKQSTEINDHAIHLLFSANRWEAAVGIIAALERGQNVIVDRYAYSGIAYTLSKVNTNVIQSWATESDRGLPAPDVVLFLKISHDAAAKRGQYGQERFENKEMQARVAIQFAELHTASFISHITGPGKKRSLGFETPWRIIDAEQSVEQVHAEMVKESHKVIERVANTPIRRF